MSNFSLVLQKVNRSSSGNYSCYATNLEGEGESNVLQLIVKCKFGDSYDETSFSFLLFDVPSQAK